MSTFTPILSNSPLNSNVGFNNSWLEIDNDTSRYLCAQAVYDLNSSNYSTTSEPTISNLTSNTNALLLSSNPSRTLLFLQNIGTSPIFIKYGLSASITSGGYNFVVAGGSRSNDGTGEKVSDSSYNGPVSIVVGSGGGSVVFWEA